MADDARQLAKPADDPVLTFAEACEHLTSPYAQEDYSAATGQPWVSVDLTNAGNAPDNLGPLREALGRFVCPTLAVVPDPSTPAARAIASAFDVVVATRAELQPLVAAARRTPIAASALVQLLRANEHRTIEEALVAESFVYSTLQAGPEFARWLQQQPTLRPVIPEEPPVLVERTGPRLDIVLNHPAKRNAYSAAMRDHLCEALQLALADDTIEEIVLRANGPDFCSGGDLDEFGLLPDPATAHAIRTTRSAARLLAACAPRLRAELHGACIGAGIELPAWSPHITATEDTWFQLPELTMGLIPGAGGTVSLPRRIGRQASTQLALAGARLALVEANTLGLID